MLISTFFIILVLISVTGLAQIAFKLAHIPFKNSFERLIFACSLGLGGLSYLVFAIGSMGILERRTWIIAFIIIGTLMLKPVLNAIISMPLGWLKEIRGLGIAGIVLSIAIITAIFFGFIGALAPAIGQDELCYHLAQPKNYIREGQIYEVPYSVNALWPYMMHMLFTLGLILKGAALAKLFHFTTYVLAGLSIGAFVNRYSNFKTAFVAAGVYWLIPGTFVQSSFAYVDNALALYCFLAVFAMSVYLSDTKQKSWAFITGLCAGFAISIKLIGIFILPALVALIIYTYFQKETKNNCNKKLYVGSLIFLTGLFIAGSLWYIRSWVLRGNPVYPFYPHLFGNNGWIDPSYINVHGRNQNLLGFLSLLWDMTLHADWFGGEQIGPMYLMFLPLILFFRPLPKYVRTTLLALLVYTIFWFIVDANIRFFYAGLALCAIPTGYVITNLLQTPSKMVNRLASYSLILSCLVSMGFGAHHYQDEVRLLFERNRTAYLNHHDRSYAAATKINAALDRDAWILSVDEVRIYYFDSRITLEGDFNSMTQYGNMQMNPNQIIDYLKKIGFTHVLTASKTSMQNSMKPEWSGRIQSIIHQSVRVDARIKLTLEVSSAGVNYSLYELT